MRKFITALLLFTLSITALAQKTKEIFKITPIVIEQGADIKVNYDPSINGITAATAVKGSVYVYKNFKWEGFDLPLVKTDTGYTANYNVPVGTGMLAFRYAIGDSIDRGARFPYAAVVHEPGKKIAPGSFIEWGLLRSKDAAGEMSPLVAKESLIAPNVLVQLWISKEFQTPIVKRSLFYDIALGIKADMEKEKADSILYKVASNLSSLPDATEKELISIERVYERILNDKVKADELKATILAKFPNGLMFRLNEIKGIYLTQDKDKKVALWNSFIKQYPFSTYPYSDYTDIILGDRSFFSNAYVGVTNINFQAKNYDAVIKLVSEAPFGLVNYFYDHYVVYPFRAQVSPITEREALTLSNAFTAATLKRIDAANLIDRGVFAPTEWKKQEMINNLSIFSNHINLLYKNKQYADALKLADRLKEFAGYKNIAFNSVYAKLLFLMKKTSLAKEYVVNAVKSDTADPEIIALLKANYSKEDGDGKDFDAYYTFLRPGTKLESMQKRLKAQMVRIPAPNFELENLSGQKVNLSKQKGKIVVLDFWASWCFPCKAAMPGMQTLVNKYEPKGDVSFYFIATLEHSPNYKKLINDFLADKKYNFNVLYDTDNPETKKMGNTFDEYAKRLKLNGIPQKVVIDQDGLVRWISDGFNGDLVELTDEVSFIVDQLKNEKYATR